MKKIFLAVVILLVIGLLAVVIFKRPNSDVPDSSDSLSSSTSDTASSSEPAAEMILPAGFASEPIHFVSMQQKGVSESGYYYTLQQADGSINIHYLDRDSASSIVLCNRPECTHKDESCRSWVQSVYNVPRILPCGDRLILIYPGSSSASEKASDAARIDVMSADGSDVKTLHTFDSHYTLKTDFALSDHLLFYSAVYYPDLNSSKSHLILEALNLETGETYRIHDFDSETYFFIGAFGNNLYVKGIEGASANTSNPLDAQTHTIWRVCASSGERELVFSYKGNEYSVLLQEDSLFYAFRLDRTVHKINGETGEDSTLDVSAALNEFLSTAAPNATRVLFYPQFILEDKNLIVQADTLGEEVSDTKSLLFNIDISQNTVTPITLKTDLGSDIVPLQVKAVLNDSLLVVPRYSQQNVTIPAPDGTMMSYTDSLPHYALISFNDYLGSNANYQMIQNR